ncbi:succinate dehydrogenase assembly factor 1, mitochondrial isoform X3 [Talpa occidentalis]|nr:succinate dehydrogenase assembly factor 1, mitochondrial isoform X3 [Talpa occidentalis]
MSRPSRLQRQVLSLYRELLRAGRGKPGAEARVRAEFRQNASLPRSDVLRIEYLYRRGRRQLQLLRSSHATALGAFVRLRDPTEDPRGMGTSPDDDKRRRGALDGPGAPENPSNRRKKIAVYTAGGGLSSDTKSWTFSLQN